MAQYQGSCWYCFTSKTQRTAAERSGPNLRRYARFSLSRIKWKLPGWVVEGYLNYLACIWLDMGLLP